MRKRISVYLMATFYFFAGLNHFIRPGFYKSILPDYIPFHSLVNYLSAFIEIVLALLLLIPRTRRYAATMIIAMLIAFLPVHIDMVINGYCPNGSCTPLLFLWVRLIIVQPLLILWAWYIRKQSMKVIL